MARYLYHGLRRLAEQPAAAARGVRHVRHEGGAQRRAQPVHPRRLVGRDVRRRQRLGDPVAPTASSTRTGATTSRRRALYDLIENQVALAVLRPRPRRPAAALDGDGAAHAAVARPARCWRPGWCATTSSQLYAPAAAVVARGGGGRRTPARASWPAGRSGCARRGPACAVEHVESSGVGDAPELGQQLELRAVVDARHADAGRRRRAGRVRPGRRERRDPRARRRSSWRRGEHGRTALALRGPVPLERARRVRLHRAGAAGTTRRRLAGRARPDRAAGRVDGIHRRSDGARPQLVRGQRGRLVAPCRRRGRRPSPGRSSGVSDVPTSTCSGLAASRIASASSGRRGPGSAASGRPRRDDRAGHGPARGRGQQCVRHLSRGEPARREVRRRPRPA